MCAGGASGTLVAVLPGMQASAARVFEQRVVPGLLPEQPSREKNREKRRKKTA